MFPPNKSKSCGTLKGMPQPFFRAQSTPTGPITRGRAVYINLSRSPDLRILSQHTAFSGNFPMTDFRLVCSLRAYSGGTVPDLHRIHYSPLSLRRYQRHSNLYSIQPLSAAALRSTRAVLKPGHLSGRRCERREFIVSDPLHTVSQRNTKRKMRFVPTRNAT